MLIRHKKYPQLVGELKEDNFVQWNEPWLAATLIEDAKDLLYLSSNEYEVVESEEESQEFFGPRNIVCTNCRGRGALRVTDRRELLKVGPWKECFKCKGSGQIRAGVD